MAAVRVAAVNSDNWTIGQLLIAALLKFAD